MKFQATHHDQTYVIDLQERDDTNFGPHFEITIHRPEGEQVLPVVVLSQTQGRLTMEVEGQIEDVTLTETQGELLVDWRNRTFPIRIYSDRQKLRLESVRAESEGVTTLRAQMPGQVVSVLAQEGQSVEAGQGLVIVEAMKMQNELRSPKSGTITMSSVKAGTSVSAGDVLFEIE